MSSFGTARRGSTSQAFRVEGDAVVYLPAADVGELLRNPALLTAEGEPAATPDAADLLPPIVQPEKIICAGLNYHAHAREVGKVAPEYPTLFSKYPTALVGPRSPIRMPPRDVSAKVDWEAELVIVIGSQVKRADAATAAAAIFGYTAMNDVSMRDWQKRTEEWLQGKNFDESTPLGPVVVSADELDVETGLSVETYIGDTRMQSGRTSDLIFGPVKLVEYISSFMTLRPGDMIATGTPAGVGSGRTPPQFLSDGDELITRIQGIGELRNRCVIEEVAAS